MANPNDAVFEIDAGKILAKLHLAGQEQLASMKAIAINTGIVNPVAKATPKDPGKVEFDLDNKTGEYQFAVLKILSYKVPLDISKNKKIIKLQEELEKAKEKDAKDSKNKPVKKEEKPNEQNAKKEETDKKTSLTAQVKTQVKDSLQVKSFLDFLIEADNPEENKDDANSSKSEVDKKSKTYEAQEKLLKELESFKIQNYKADPDNFDDSIKEFNEAVKTENEERIKAKEEYAQKLQKIAFNDIKTYFKTISGEKNAAKIKESDLVKMNADIDGGIKDPTQFQADIKNFKITTATIDKGVEAYEQKIQASDKPSDNVERNILFAVGFTVEIETM